MSLCPDSERDFQRQVVELFAWNRWLTWHAYDARRANAGFPDLVLVHAVHGTVFAELKMERGRVRREQEVWLNTLRASGERAYLWRPSHWDSEIVPVASGRIVADDRGDATLL